MSLRSVPAAGLTRMIYWALVVGNVGDNRISSYRLHACETPKLATTHCYLCGVDTGAAVNQ